ncbi:MAG: hypothetical protein R3C03_12080 [Pirellulaceae bacterium]
MIVLSITLEEYQMRIALLITITSFFVVGLAQQVQANLILAADDFDLVAADFTTVVSSLNANFDELVNAINANGGSVGAPIIFSPEDLGADDLVNAADHLRNTQLSLSADDFDLVAADFTTVVSSLNANFDELVNAINANGGSVGTDHLFA